MTEQVLPELLPTSRFQIYATPIVNPGKCAVCGAVDQPVIDFGLNIDFYGAVMLCTTNCLPEAARAIGMVSMDRLMEAEAGLAQSLNEQLSSRNLVAVAKETYDAAIVALAGLSNGFLLGDDSSFDLVAEPADENFDPADGLSNEDKSGDTGSTEQGNNAAVSEGPASVPSSSGDGISDFAL